MPSFTYAPGALVIVVTALFVLEASSVSVQVTVPSIIHEDIAEDMDDRPKRLMRRDQDALEATSEEFKDVADMDLLAAVPAPTPLFSVRSHATQNRNGNEDFVAPSPPVPPPPDEDLIKAGHCHNWTRGSSFHGHAKFDDWFLVPTMDECRLRAKADPAVEQAEFHAADRGGLCVLGVGTMRNDPTPSEDGSSVECFGRHGFSHTEHLVILDGMCPKFFTGYAANPVEQKLYQRQCDYHTGNQNPGGSESNARELCNHWGPEFALSERGCWAKCQINEQCQSAEYDEQTFDCKIGLQPVATHTANVQRCETCKSKCYARWGLGNTTVDYTTIFGVDFDGLSAHLAPPTVWHGVKAHGRFHRSHYHYDYWRFKHAAKQGLNFTANLTGNLTAHVTANTTGNATGSALLEEDAEEEAHE
jgi:hypothetical protein